MKRHILGLAIFSLILASFGFALFYSKRLLKPINKETEVVNVRTPMKACYVKTNDILYEILDAQFDEDNDRFIAKVIATWQGEEDAPKYILVKTKLYTLPQNDATQHFETETYSKPFDKGKTAELIVKFDVAKFKDFNYKQNLYTIFNFGENFGSPTNSYSGGCETDAKSVLYFHRTNLTTTK